MAVEFPSELKENCHHNVIKYGVSRDYLPNWTVEDALREIYQNAKDHGNHQISVDIMNNGLRCELNFYNEFTPDDLGFLQIGSSSKRGKSDKIGCHGEGLKMALLVLLRNEVTVQVYFNSKMIYPVWYSDAHFGESFGLRIVSNQGTSLTGFNVKIYTTTEKYEIFNSRIIKPSDIIHNHNYGRIINKPAGDIFVGGIFVANMKNLSYSYDFEPSIIKLDRDRKLPSNFDVEFYAAQILSTYSGVKIQDMVNRDFTFMTKVPDHLKNSCKPVIIGKEVVFMSKEVGVMPEHVTKMFLQDTGMMKKVSKLRYSIKTRKCPNTLLEEFFDKYKYCLNAEAMSAFDTILLQSKNWCLKK